MLNLFKEEIRNELKKHPPVTQGVFIEADLKVLPELVQRYFRTCGWIGKPKMTNAAFCILDMKLKLDLNQDFETVRAYQFNSVSEPMRIALMKAKMFGMISISARDKYQSGIGNMLIKLVNLITIANAKGAEINHSGLVTVLAETFLVPAYALQPYIKWESESNNAVRGTITDHNNSVSGTFFFSDDGEVQRFETSDRFMSLKNGKSKQVKWMATFSNYQYRQGVRIATEVSAFWVTETGNQEYARMKIADVLYDINNVDSVFFNK